MTPASASSRMHLSAAEEQLLQDVWRESDNVVYKDMYHPITLLIKETFEALEAEEQAVLGPKGLTGERTFKDLMREQLWPHRETTHKVIDIYYKQFRNPAVEKYHSVIEAAKRQLQNKDLSLRDRVQLLHVMDKASEKLLHISQVFSEFILSPNQEEVLDHVIAEEQALIQENLAIIQREIKKIEDKPHFRTLTSQNQDIENKIKFLNEKIERKIKKNSEELKNALRELKQLKEEKSSKLFRSNKAEIDRINKKIKFAKKSIANIKSKRKQLILASKNQKAELGTEPELQSAIQELERLKNAQKKIQTELKPLADELDSLKKMREACEKRLKDFQEDINKKRTSIEQQVKTSEVVQEVANLTSPFLADQAAELAGTPKPSDQADIIGSAVQGAINTGIAKKGNKIRVGKKEVASLAKKVALAALKYIATLAAGALATYAVAHVVPFAIAVSAVAVFAIGIYMIKDKPYFVKMMSYPKGWINSLSTKLSQLHKTLEKKMKPHLQVAMERKPLSDSHKKMVAHLQYIVDQAKLSTEKAKLTHEVKDLENKLSKAKRRPKGNIRKVEKQIERRNKKLDQITQQILTGKNEQQAQQIVDEIEQVLQEFKIAHPKKYQASAKNYRAGTDELTITAAAALQDPKVKAKLKEKHLKIQELVGREKANSLVRRFWEMR